MVTHRIEASFGEGTVFCSVYSGVGALIGEGAWSDGGDPTGYHPR